MNKLTFNNTPNECVKTEDGRTVWLSRSVAVLGLIVIKYNEELYVLLNKRGQNTHNHQGKWCIPCGYLDYNETTYEGVCRELYEETGFDLNSALNKYSIIKGNSNKSPFHINDDPKGDSLQNITFRFGYILDNCFKLPKLSKKYAEENEVDDVKWIKLDEALNLDLAFNHNKIIKEFTNLEQECI